MGDSAASTDEAESPSLRSFRPQFVADDHSLYVKLLLDELQEQEPSQNIALSGAYGSGKSSVLKGLLAELEKKSAKRKPVKAVQVSLATLNQSRASLLDVAGELTLTAALEKEVVKRLLYSVKPQEIPRSRFNRIAGFRLAPAAGLSVVAGVLAVGAATTFGIELPLTQLADAIRWSHGVGLAADLVGTSALALAAQRTLASLRLSEIALGPAKLSLDDKNGNYFDHYLDEIVYFFERTKTRVIVFEDLDRFDDPGIFLALRELNNLLNNSDQVEQPVTFVYAIRDSLFVQAVKVEPAGHQDVADSGSPAVLRGARAVTPDAHAKYGTELAASDRAKFFDFIVPIVPFISHEVAADLLLKSVSALPERLRPSRPLVTMAGRHFTDMRVIHSIRNEYAVFAAELLDKSAVEGLTQDQLFAMVLYKHLYLDDFERIRTGESLLDSAIDKVRAWVSHTVTAIDVATAAVEDAIEAEEAIDSRAAVAGAGLLKRVDAFLRILGQGDARGITPTGARMFSLEEVGTREFWQALAAASDQGLTLYTTLSQRSIAPADWPILFGPEGNPKFWLSRSMEADRQKLARLKEARTWVRTSSIAELLGGPFPAVDLEAEPSWDRLGTECSEIFGDQLVYELLRGGYLDQNFAIYTTKFHGGILSARARSYLMQYVDRHRNDPLFDLSADEVREIVSRRGDAFLADKSSLNVSVVDHLLATEAPKLPNALETSGQAGDFISTYLANGAAGADLLKRLAPVRPDIFDVVLASASSSDAERRSHVDKCFTALSGDIEYTLSYDSVAFVGSHLDSMPALAAQMGAEVSGAAADLLAAHGLKVADLSRVVEPLRSHVATRGCFQVTRDNLAVVTGDSGRVGLDSLGEVHTGVARYMLTNLPEYLNAIGENPAGSIVDDGDNLDTVVRAILDHDRDELHAALAALKPGMAYEELAAAPEEVYSDLAEAGAFALTRENVTRYIDVVGEIDLALAGFLDRSQAIVVVEVDETDTDEEAARNALAVAVIRSPHLASEVKLELVASLETKTTLSVPKLSLHDAALAAGLLSAGEIADTAETFAALAGGPWTVFEACAAASNTFNEFVGELSLTDDFLAKVLLSPKVSDTAKRRLLTDFDTRQPALAATGAGAWMAAASGLDFPLTVSQVVSLGQAGAAPALVLQFLLREHSRLTAPEIVSILGFCGAPYTSFGLANGASLTVPHSEDMREILQTLKDASIVQYFRKKKNREEFIVGMAG